ncbi:MAG: hypothetical protein HF973_17820, partial [Chloroflexi bacterium]|nr:hypothetical protein [Chloroflexota bacterium]
PMQALANQLGAAGLDQIFTDFGFYIIPDLPLAAETAVPDPVDNPLLAGIGQDNLFLTPIQLALAWAALGNDGQAPPPWLVTAVQDPDGAWQPEPPTGQPLTPISGFVARDVAEVLGEDGRTEYNTLVLSGPEGRANAWYLGLAPATNPRYAVVVILEESHNAGEAKSIGREMLAEHRLDN